MVSSDRINKGPVQLIQRGPHENKDPLPLLGESNEIDEFDLIKTGSTTTLAMSHEKKRRRLLLCNTQDKIAQKVGGFAAGFRGLRSQTNIITYQLKKGVN